MMKKVSPCDECGIAKCTGCLEKSDVYTIYKCDNCGSEEDTIYEYNGEQYCESCILDILKNDGVIKEVSI